MDDAAIFNRLGEGYNTFEDSLRNKIIAFDFNKDPVDSKCWISSCSSMQELSEKLEIGASLGYTSDSAHLEAKANFLSTFTQSSNALTVIVQSKVSWGGRADNAKFLDSVDAKASIKDAATLVEHAGDSYIKSLRMGVEYYACYQFITTSSEQRKKIEAEVSGKVGKFDGAVKLDFERIATDSGSKYTFNQTVSGAALTLPNQNDVAKFALELPGKAASSPMVLGFTTESYSHLIQKPQGLEKVDEWIKAYLQPKWFNESLKSIEAKAKVTEQAIRSVASLYKFYGAGSLESSINVVADGCYNAGNIIRAWKAEFKNGQGTLNRPSMDVSCFQIPEAQFELLFPWSWGNFGGGEPWVDVDEDFVYAYGYPKTWHGCGGKALDMMTTTYAYRNPQAPDDSRAEFRFDRQHGSNRDGHSPQLSFDYTFKPNEIGAVGAWKSPSDPKDYICGMEVKRKSDLNTSCLLGNMGGPFQGNFIPEGSSFLGWKGRSHDSIDVLGPICVKFEAPKWTSMNVRSVTGT